MGEQPGVTPKPKTTKRAIDKPAETLDIGPKTIFIGQSSSRYSVIRALGGGGNANVYLVSGVDGPYHGVLAAAKVFRTLSMPNRLARFLGEIENTRKLKHPSIMQLYDEGRHEATDGSQHPFFIAEYLPTTVESALLRPVSTLRKVSYMTQILSALFYLESLSPQGIHRDIKPDNIFIKGETCVLGDLGLLKFLSGDEDEADDDRAFYIESTGSAFPRHYRSPELVSYAAGGPRPTTRSDVFQLGLVASKLFTGSNPMKPGANKYAEVALFDLKPVIGAEFAVTIGDLLTAMLGITSPTPLASEILPLWGALMGRVTDHAVAFDGVAL